MHHGLRRTCSVLVLTAMVLLGSAMAHGAIPTINSLVPANNAGDVPPSANLVITFSENVQTNGGSITVTNMSGGTVSAAVSVAGATLTIDPDVDLALETTYAVLIETNAVKDMTTNYFAGILDTVTWRFTTEDPALWVYEGFDMSLNDGDSIKGSAGGTSFGFDVGSTWGGETPADDGVDDVGTYSTAGLTMGSDAYTLATAGGSMISHDAVRARNWIQRALDVSMTGGATVYASYLYNLIVTANNQGRLCVTNPGGSDTFDVRFGGGFYARANGTKGYIVGFGRGGGWPPTYGAQNLSGQDLGTGVNAICLFSITKVGGASGAVDMWQYVLTSDQFDHFKAGGLTAAELQAATLGAAADQVSQRGYSVVDEGVWPRWTATDVLRLWWYDQPDPGGKAVIDEIRFGNSLDVVTPLATAFVPTGALLIVR